MRGENKLKCADTLKKSMNHDKKNEKTLIQQTKNVVKFVKPEEV